MGGSVHGLKEEGSRNAPGGLPREWVRDAGDHADDALPPPAPSTNRENRNRMSVVKRRMIASCRSMFPTTLVSLNRIARVNDRSTCCHSDCCGSRLS